MKTNRSMSYPNETLYVTARATVSCAAFKAGEFVSVKFFQYGDNGEAWYLINRTENGPTANEVAYPKSHLTDFCL